MRFFCLLSILLLTSCGGSGDSGSDVSLPETRISISTNQSSQLVTKTVTLTWSSVGADTCAASGDWEGDKPLNGSEEVVVPKVCLLYTSPSPRDATLSRMPSSA